jgi:hypothetical protein
VLNDSWFEGEERAARTDEGCNVIQSLGGASAELSQFEASTVDLKKRGELDALMNPC